MNSAPIPLLACAVLLGSLSAGAVTYLMLDDGSSRSREASSPSVQPDLARAGDELLALRARVDALVQQSLDLQMRLAMLEDRPAPATRTPIEGFLSKAEFDAFAKDVRASLAVRAIAAAEPQELKEQVAGALIDLRKEEAVKQVRDYQEKRTARLDKDVEEITERLALSSYQAQEMRTLLADQYEREDEVRRLWEDGADDELLGARKETSREEFQSDLERALTPEQVTRFWEMVSQRGKN